MVPELQTFGQALQGPLGGLLAWLFVAWALFKGHLRLGREVVSVQGQLERALHERDRYEALVLEQVGLTKRVAQVAQTAVQRVPTP